MNILMFVEQLEHIAGMEKIALQMGYALEQNGHNVVYGITYGAVPSDKSVLTFHEYDLPNLAKGFDVIINHCDWNYRILEAINQLREQKSSTKVYTICHSDFWSALSQPSTPNHDLLPLYWKLKSFMKMITINTRDYKCFCDIGYQTYLWEFGTEESHEKIHKNQTKVFNRIAFVSARWSLPKKNYKYAEMLFDKLSSVAPCEVVAFGRDWKGKDNYAEHYDIYKQGTIIVMPSFRETRPLTSISAYKSNCPIFCFSKWNNLPNEYILSGSLSVDVRNILEFVGKRVKQYKRRVGLDLNYSMLNFIGILEDDSDLPINIDTTSEAYLACRSRIEYQSNFESSGLIYDYRNNWIPQKSRVLILADGVGATNKVETKLAEYIICYRQTILSNNSDLNHMINTFKPTYVGIMKDNKFLLGNNIIQYDKRIVGYDVIDIKGVATFYLTDRYKFDNSGSETPVRTIWGDPSILTIEKGEF